MKRVTQFTVLIIILILFLASCSFKSANNKVSLSPSAETSEKNPDIIIQSPVTLSNNSLLQINGKKQFLRLKMVKGRYYEDWGPGAYSGTIWEGNFIIEIADELGNMVAQTNLSKIYKEPLIFKSQFSIEFEDYNGDGDADFTIGQYASSNGRNYKLFTVRKGGKIEELHVKDYPELFISKTTGFYSTKLTKVDNVSFKKQYHDNSKGISFEDTFKWERKEFIRVKTQEIKNN